jgi:tetratricopeptide (TPR) repeat protein/transcriptional regulator with XRE-family HTH domain
MEETQPVSFGQGLLRERKMQQWTQVQLAENIGASVPSIDRWEHDRATPRNEMIEQLTSVFGRPPERWGTNRWCNIPYLRNPYFTGREEVLQRLQKALVSHKSGDSHKIRAISGMGGIGKTQVALEFAYRYADEYDAVLWVHAEDSTLKADVVKLAETLHLPDREKLNPFLAREAVKGWLQDHDRWLLIFDNVENVANVFNILPNRYCGSVILTTRFQNADPHMRSLEMEKMSLLEGKTFLLRRTRNENEDETREANLPASERAALTTLWETMDGLPLALDQAGAYIKMAQCSFQEYVNLYRKHRRDLLREREAHIPEHPDAVATTWDVSFQQIERENPAAAEFLRLCAFLAPDAIPEKLIIWGTTHCTAPLQKLAASEKLLKDVIKLLYSYSLIQRDAATQMLLIHRLVQAALIDAMSIEVREVWKRRVLRILNTAFPEASFEAPFEELRRCGQLLPHIQSSALEIEYEPIATQLEAAALFERAGSYLREQGQYAEAETLLRLSLTLREHHLSPDDLALATSLSNLAGLYFYQDCYQKAAILVERAFAIRQQRLGTDHQETTESLKHLALLYLRQEQYEQAEPLFLQSLAISEHQMGQESPATTNRMSNLALLYMGQERYDKAEPLFKRAFSLNKRCLGALHPETGRTMENLAFLYLKQGRYRRAEPLLYQAFTIHAQNSGLESPDTAYPLYGLAELWFLQKNYALSESMHQHVLSMRQRHLGENHLDTAESLQALADLYQEWAKYEEAVPFYVRTLAIREKILRWESPSLLKIRQAYAALLQKMGQQEEKRVLFRP